MTLNDRQPSRQLLNAAAHRPRWRASDAAATDRKERPVVPDMASLRAMTVSELVRLRATLDIVLRQKADADTPSSMAGRPAPRIVVATVNAAALAHGVTVADIVGPARDQKVFGARKLVAATLYSMRKEDGSRRFGMTAIGRYLGDRDHSTIKNAINRFDGDLLPVAE